MDLIIKSIYSIKADKNNSDFLKKHSFFLVTNKSENDNDYINSLYQFINDNDVNYYLEILNKLKNKTKAHT